jgi:hypothetical protein
MHEDNDSDDDSDILTVIQETTWIELLRRRGRTMTLKRLPASLTNEEGI